MEEISGDLWDYQGRAILALTTNGSLSRDQRDHFSWPEVRPLQKNERFSMLLKVMREAIEK